MPGNTIPLGTAELTESTAVSFKCGLKVRSPWAGVYKISQNLSGNLHSLGVARGQILAWTLTESEPSAFEAGSKNFNLPRKSPMLGSADNGATAAMLETLKSSARAVGWDQILQETRRAQGDSQRRCGSHRRARSAFAPQRREQEW